MANHKRHRPKQARAGCLMCKWWKFPAAERSARRLSVRRVELREQEGRSEANGDD